MKLLITLFLFLMTGCEIERLPDEEYEKRYQACVEKGGVICIRWKARED